jgi:FKBP-type peptidyl-prolyl cis-trans isomerase
MKKIILALVCLSSATAVFADGTNQLADEKSRVSYAIGMMTGRNWQQQGLELDADVYLHGIKDSMAGGKMLLTPEQAQETLQKFQSEFKAKQLQKRAEQTVKNKADGEAYLAANKKNAGVKTISVQNQEGQPSELQYLVLTSGSGATPTANDIVKVNYAGTLIDGTEFDSSYKRGQPAEFQVGGVIKGWTAALQQMKVGSKWKLFIPADLAYGEGGRPGIPPNSTLIFEVELLDSKSPAPPVQPTPVAPLTSDIIKVPSAEELKKGAKIEYIKPEDAAKAAQKSAK